MLILPLCNCSSCKKTRTFISDAIYAKFASLMNVPERKIRANLDHLRFAGVKPHAVSSAYVRSVIRLGDHPALWRAMDDGVIGNNAALVAASRLDANDVLAFAAYIEGRRTAMKSGDPESRPITLSEVYAYIRSDAPRKNGSDHKSEGSQPHAEDTTE